MLISVSEGSQTAHIVLISVRVANKPPYLTIPLIRIIYLMLNSATNFEATLY